MIGSLITLIIWLVVVGVLIALVYYICDAIPIPQPINKFIKIGVTVVACLVLLLMLLQLLGVSTGVDVPNVGG